MQFTQLVIVVTLLLSSCTVFFSDTFKVSCTEEYISFSGHHSSYGKEFNFDFEEIVPEKTTEECLTNHFNLLNFTSVRKRSFIVFIDNFKSGRIYFNKKNPNYKFKPFDKVSILEDQIGILKKETWYLVSDLKHPWSYYIYLDSSGVAEIIKINPHNI